MMIEQQSQRSASPTSAAHHYSGEENIMSNVMTAAMSILPSLVPCEPNDGPGYVGRVQDGASVQDLTQRLTAAGYEVSDSRDEDGVRWVWVA